MSDYVYIYMEIKNVLFEYCILKNIIADYAGSLKYLILTRSTIWTQNCFVLAVALEHKTVCHAF